jgi:hypothetical protein
VFSSLPATLLPASASVFHPPTVDVVIAVAFIVSTPTSFRILWRIDHRFPPLVTRSKRD